MAYTTRLQWFKSKNNIYKNHNYANALYVLRKYCDHKEMGLYVSFLSFDFWVHTQSIQLGKEDIDSNIDQQSVQQLVLDMCALVYIEIMWREEKATSKWEEEEEEATKT